MEFTLPFTLCAEAADARPIQRPAAKPIVINFFVLISQFQIPKATESPDIRSTDEQIAGETAKRGCRASANEIDDGPAVHHACKVKRVPIGEADATVRFSLADFFGRGRAVDAVTRRREIDPN